MKRLLMLSLLLSIAALQAIREGEPHPRAPIPRRPVHGASRMRSLANVEGVKTAQYETAKEIINKEMEAAKASPPQRGRK